MPSAELALRLRVEELIAAGSDLGAEEAVARVLEVGAVATALGAVGMMDLDAAVFLIADTIDALVVRGAPSVEPLDLDLGIQRLHDVAAGAARPRLRRVVPVAAGGVCSLELWDDVAEVRVVGAAGEVLPSVYLDAVSPREERLEITDADGEVLGIDLSRGRVASDGGTQRQVDTAGYLEAHLRYAVGVARANPTEHTLNLLRRLVGAVAAELGGGDVEGHDACAAFDAAVAADATPSSSPVRVEVVPVALRTPVGWLLSIERWSDHWRAVVRAEGRGWWTATDDRGSGYGGHVLSGEVLRFDPALPTTWSSLTISHLGPDGTVVDVDVVRR